MKKNYFLWIIFFAISINLLNAAEKKHHTAMFLGVTSGTYTNGHTDFTIGLEYEYRLTKTDPNIGFGLMMEMILAQQSETVLALPVFVHPLYGLKVFVAPSIVLFSETKTGEPDQWGKETNLVSIKSDNEWFVRLGVGYDFHFNQFSVSPIVTTDMIAGKMYVVFGLGLGIGF